MRIINPLPIERDALKMLGRPYGLGNQADRRKFDEMWKICRHAREYKSDNKDALEAEVRMAYRRLGRLVDPSSAGEEVSLTMGHRSVERRRLSAGPYVVFSDHHMAEPGHPVDFFHRANLDLYIKVLRHYARLDYTLVENGDLEELVILDLTQDQAEEMWRVFRQADELSVRELRRVGYLALRKELRLAALERIFTAYEGLYEVIENRFHSQGRYVRLAGNHDQDLQDEDFERLLRERYPGITVHDYLFLDEDVTRNVDGRLERERLVRHVVGHGHQFDTATTPAFARLQGEIFSECMSWAFQGPDRVWDWADDSRKWADEGQAFRNALVDAVPATELSAELLAGLTTGRVVDLAGVSDAVARACIEALTQNNIAWDYFESTRFAGVLQEVTSGQEFFKFRHLDEQRLEALYPQFVRESDGSTPTLTLGHTHEVRQNAVGAAGTAFSSYLNSGAAGRFERLIWAVEIDGDEARIVGWSEDSAGTPFYRVFAPRPRRGLVPGDRQEVSARPSRLGPLPTRDTGPRTSRG